MTKNEYIKKYGEEAYRIKCKRHLESNKKWIEKNKERWRKYHNNLNGCLKKKRREKGITYYCRENYELIENYELAKADNFDPKKWHLHHRLENYWSSKTLIRKGLYYNVNPEALIWLPNKEHNSDKSLSTLHPELSKWHKRMLE